MPMPPPAPALFSMTTGEPSARPIASASGRPTISATPPGGNGTIIVIGFDGYASCAAGGDAAASAATSTITREGNIRAFMRLLQELTVSMDYSGATARAPHRCRVKGDTACER